jgi:hypothetical protein
MVRVTVKHNGERVTVEADIPRITADEAIAMVKAALNVVRVPEPDEQTELRPYKVTFYGGMESDQITM